MTFQITATIGRNLPTTGQLPLQRWEQFEENVRGVFLSTLPAEGMLFFQTFRGTGVWQSEPEDAIHFLFVTETAPTNEVLNKLRARLAHTAYWFNQDAIAIGLGSSELVTAAQ